MGLFSLFKKNQDPAHTKSVAELLAENGWTYHDLQAEQDRFAYAAPELQDISPPATETTDEEDALLSLSADETANPAAEDPFTDKAGVAKQADEDKKENHVPVREDKKESQAVIQLIQTQELMAKLDRQQGQERGNLSTTEQSAVKAKNLMPEQESEQENTEPDLTVCFEYISDRTATSGNKEVRKRATHMFVRRQGIEYTFNIMKSPDFSNEALLTDSSRALIAQQQLESQLLRQVTVEYPHVLNAQNYEQTRRSLSLQHVQQRQLTVVRPDNKEKGHEKGHEKGQRNIPLALYRNSNSRAA